METTHSLQIKTQVFEINVDQQQMVCEGLKGQT
jgi:hypothetical protein